MSRRVPNKPSPYVQDFIKNLARDVKTPEIGDDTEVISNTSKAAEFGHIDIDRPDSVAESTKTFASRRKKAYQLMMTKFKERVKYFFVVKMT